MTRDPAISSSTRKSKKVSICNEMSVAAELRRRSTHGAVCPLRASSQPCFFNGPNGQRSYKDEPTWSRITCIAGGSSVCPGSQGQANTAALFIYSGEVSCNFSSQGATSISDQLIILLEPDFTSTTQIVGGLNVNPSIPLVVPTSWNANNAFSVIAINTPELLLVTASAPPIVPGGVPGLYIVAQVTVQNGMLLNVQYQVSVRGNLGLCRRRTMVCQGPSQSSPLLIRNPNA